MPEFTLRPVGNPFARRHNFYRKVATIPRQSGNEKGGGRHDLVPRHAGPSIIDVRTLTKFDPLPLEFLRGVGLPENYMPSRLSEPIQYYSCFISYSSKDDDFAKRIH